MNEPKLMKIKKLTEDLIGLNELEEKILSQKAKIEWLKLGDGKNIFFHASLKAKHHAKSIASLSAADGSRVTSHAKIEEAILDYYGRLMGQKEDNLSYIDVTSMREGPHLTVD
ncbi:unnamed protein product [Lathyrus sativus]|nr:unnamed protein product [Lathyrus sativus]